MSAVIDNLREPGSRLWFEYHCNESHQSPDAPVWYRSHQQCTVLSCVNAEDYGDMPQNERFYTGHVLVYRVRFDDGLEWDVFEDELLDSSKEFQRPTPPAANEH